MVWLALITLLSACMTEQAQASLILVEEWVARHNSPSWGGTIVLDGSGTVYVAGTVNNASTSDDYLTVAYDSAGHLLWEAHYDGVASAEDHAIGMASGPSGNVYVTGRSKSTPSWIGYDYTTVAYDSSGNQQWVARYDGPGNGEDQSYGIVVDPSSGNVYITGYSNGGNRYRERTTIAYDPSGNQLWTASYYSPPGDALAYHIAMDASGNVYTAGIPNLIKYDSSGNLLWVANSSLAYGTSGMGLDEFGNSYMTHGNWNRASGTGDFVTAAFDSSGSLLWEVTYDGPAGGHETQPRMDVDSSGNIYVAGSSDGEDSDDDYATIAYDPLGNELWTARYNGPGNGEDGVGAVAVDSSGNVYVTGGSDGGSTSTDCTTVAYDSSGNELSVARYNGPWNGRDWGTAIASRTANEVYVTAVSDGNLVIIKYSLAFDTDDDGVPDDEDACPDSDLSPTVVIDGCDSGVANHLFDDGCTISDLIAIYAAEANNHGQFASSVSQFANDLVQAGLISGADKGQIQNCAAQADIP